MRQRRNGTDTARQTGRRRHSARRPSHLRDERQDEQMPRAADDAQLLLELVRQLLLRLVIQSHAAARRHRHSLAAARRHRKRRVLPLVRRLRACYHPSSGRGRLARPGESAGLHYPTRCPLAPPSRHTQPVLGLKTRRCLAPRARPHHTTPRGRIARTRARAHTSHHP